MTRQDFQELAEIRLRDARALLRAKCYDGAYYLAGYAVECALKACVARRIKRYDVPDKAFVNDVYTHDLAKLVRLAKIENKFKQEQQKNSDLQINWSIAKNWSEQSRYQKQEKHVAEKMVDAVSHPQNGVLQCLRKFW